MTAPLCCCQVCSPLNGVPSRLSSGITMLFLLLLLRAFVSALCVFLRVAYNLLQVLYRVENSCRHVQRLLHTTQIGSLAFH